MEGIYISHVLRTSNPGGIEAVGLELAVDEIVQHDLLSLHPGPGVVGSHPDHAEGDQGQDQHDHHQGDEVGSPVSW